MFTNNKILHNFLGIKQDTSMLRQFNSFALVEVWGKKMASG